MMWVVSYRTDDLAHVGGVRSSVVEHVIYTRRFVLVI
jgi:hypothetical protein